MKSELKKLKLIKANEKLIYKIASKYSIYYSIEDLFQEGVKGIIKAIDNYKENSDAEFSTYAYKYILGEIIKFISSDRTIKVSSDTLKIYRSYEKTKEYLTNKNNRIPTFYEICNFMELDPRIVSDAIEKSEFAISFDGIKYEDDFTLEQVIGKDRREEIDEMIDLKNELEKLSESDRRIIELRYYQDYSQSETAKYLGTNQVQVSRRESKILKKIKENIA